MTQTFLWWANVATRVHEGYRSFFPPDVYYVADHAKRAMSEYPLCSGRYYGVDYGARGKHGVPQGEIPSDFIPPHCRNGVPRPDNPPLYAPNDLSWYANIPVPTSYMCMGSKEDFFGGYDYHRQAGIVHIANHHISPGKKQWTWGNHRFGYAWDRNLTDEDGPYIELMAGVYTDNQPDFSFLDPGETKTWSQYWYPIQKIGPARHANLNAAVALDLHADGKRPGIRLGISVSVAYPRAIVTLTARGKTILASVVDLAPGSPMVEEIRVRKPVALTDLELTVLDAHRDEIVRYRPLPVQKAEVPPPATEPPAPEEIASADELHITGLHLEQYRHATRCPTLYWREALRRDPLDSRCNHALGLWHLRRGEFSLAESCFRRAIERLTRRNPNPHDGGAYYHLGVCLRLQLDAASAPKKDEARLFAEAYAAFYKATWNHAWQPAAYHALAELDCRRKDWHQALNHLQRALRVNADNLRARNLLVMVLLKLDRSAEAGETVAETLRWDPLDWWARHLRDGQIACDTQTRMDLALDLARAGFHAEAAGLLSTARCEAGSGTAPMVRYYLGWLRLSRGQTREARVCFARAAKEPRDYCFPARLEELLILESALREHPKDARAAYYLGNLLYDRRRHAEAIRFWERSARIDANYSVVWRNLGIAYFNVERQPDKARRAYEKALKANPGDARLLYERDQLWKRLAVAPEVRLRELKKRLPLVAERDDLSLELCALYNQLGQPGEALKMLNRRSFQPWEGGEGLALAQHKRTHLALGREALRRRDYSAARDHFAQALNEPANLGEARHPLANRSDILFWLGAAHHALGERDTARQCWHTAAGFRGNFQGMSVRSCSETTFYSALSLEKLGKRGEARKVLQELLRYANELSQSKAKIDYFATSLPAMLLFDDDLQHRQETTALFLQAQALVGLGENAAAAPLLDEVRRRDPNHPLAGSLRDERRLALDV